MFFKYNGGKTPIINRAWIDVLTAAANSGQGLLLSAEPPERHQRARVIDG
ncbi:hypothetical protein [Cryobacterium inferilacus]|nr:hypothetical protein [Cryobacterium sp. 1639]